MKLDLDQLEFNATDGIPNFVGDKEVLALIKIARAAVVWRDEMMTVMEDEPYNCERPLLDALREAGL